VNLRHLNLWGNALEYIPETISCLQKLEDVDLISNSGLQEMSTGFATLANLNQLTITHSTRWQLPPNLQISGLEKFPDTDSWYAEIYNVCIRRF
jgi:Leucine-rich repeat (LRR) protein